MSSFPFRKSFPQQLQLFCFNCKHHFHKLNTLLLTIKIHVGVKMFSLKIILNNHTHTHTHTPKKTFNIPIH